MIRDMFERFILSILNFFNMNKRMLAEEKGASDIVAVIILIVIIIAVAVIFREKLMEVVNSVMDQLTDFVG